MYHCSYVRERPLCVFAYDMRATTLARCFSASDHSAVVCIYPSVSEHSPVVGYFIDLRANTLQSFI